MIRCKYKKLSAFQLKKTDPSLPSPVESNHFVVVVRVDKDVINVALATASSDYSSPIVSVSCVIPKRHQFKLAIHEANKSFELLVETVVIERLKNGRSDATETVHVHDVVAEIVEDVILRQIGHHLIE